MFGPGMFSQQIDSLRHPPYTQNSILQAREAGKAVRIGRGPATVIGQAP